MLSSAIPSDESTVAVTVKVLVDRGKVGVITIGATDHGDDFGWPRAWVKPHVVDFGRQSPQGADREIGDAIVRDGESHRATTES